MAIETALAAQFGFGEESTWGTAVTPNRFLPMVSEAVKQDIARIKSKAIFAGRRTLDTSQVAAGDIKVGGPIHTEFYDHQMGLLLKHMFGGYSISGAGPYTQTFTPGDMVALKGLTMQVGRPDVAGTVQPFTWAGCKVAKWDIEASVNNFAMLGLDIVAKSETTATGLASVSYPASINPLTYVQGAITIAGSSVPVRSFKLSGDNNLDDKRRFLGSQLISEPLESDVRDYTGTAECEFNGLTQYNRFVNFTAAALVLTFTSGSNTLTITTNVEFDGDSPAVKDRGVVDLPVKFRCINTTDAGAITAVTVNSDNTY